MGIHVHIINLIIIIIIITIITIKESVVSEHTAICCHVRNFFSY